jgi:hypothetical protein
MMTRQIHTPVFFRFNYQLLRIMWHVKSVFLSLAGLVGLGAVIIAHVEQLPLGRALYFAFVTGLTIGYGDIVPKTVVGKLTAVMIGFVGILFTGMVVAAALRAISYSMKDLKK